MEDQNTEKDVQKVSGCLGIVALVVFAAIISLWIAPDMNQIGAIMLAAIPAAVVIFWSRRRMLRAIEKNQSD